MKKTDRIYVAGHTGLVGSAIVRRLRAEGFNHLVLRTHAELDLTDQAATELFFHREQQCAVIRLSNRGKKVVVFGKCLPISQRMSSANAGGFSADWIT